MRGSFRAAGTALFLDLPTGYTSVFFCKNSLIYTFKVTVLFFICFALIKN